MSSMKITSLVAVALVCLTAGFAAADIDEDCDICRSFVNQIVENIDDYRYIFWDFCKRPLCFGSDCDQCRDSLLSFRKIFIKLRPLHSCQLFGACLGGRNRFSDFMNVVMGSDAFINSPDGSIGAKIIHGIKWEPDLYPLCDACEHAVDYFRANLKAIEEAELLDYICKMFPSGKQKQCDDLMSNISSKLRKSQPKEFCARNGFCQNRSWNQHDDGEY